MVGAAVRTCVFGEPNVYLQTLEGLLYADSAVVRAAALIAALAWGSPLGASVLQRIVLDDPDASAQWLALYCALGGRREHERLLALLADPTRRARALFAVGFSGNAMLVDPLLTFLTSAHARERKLSAQSLSMITGLDILDAQFALAEQDDAEDDSDDLDADEDVELEPEDDLPEPNTRPFAKPAARGRPAQRPRGACSRASLSIAPA